MRSHHTKVKIKSCFIYYSLVFPDVCSLVIRSEPNFLSERKRMKNKTYDSHLAKRSHFPFVRNSFIGTGALFNDSIKQR